MTRIWSTETGWEIAAYPAGKGCRRLALSTNGKKIAPASPNGTIRIWNPEVPPRDTDIRFEVAGADVRDLSFDPNGCKLLVCLDDEI